MSDESRSVDPAAALAVGHEAMDAARAIVRRMLASGFSHRHKADRSFVTEVDLAVEKEMRELLGRAFPDHGLLGEEFPDTGAGSRYVWVVDPVDGTHSLRHRVPLFGSLLALLDGGAPIVGLIDLPELGRRYWAASGLGAFRSTEDGAGEEALSIEDLPAGVTEEEIGDEIIATGERKQFIATGTVEAFDALMAAHPSVRTYCDCFGHALALDGSAGAMVDFGLRIWDLAASEAIVHEAGGKLVRVRESVDETGERRFDVVFGKPTVVDWVLEKMDPLLPEATATA